LVLQYCRWLAGLARWLVSSYAITIASRAFWGTNASKGIVVLVHNSYSAIHYIMKNILLISAASLALAASIFNACSSPKKTMYRVNTGVANAARNFKNVEKDVILAKQDSAKVYNQFRAEAIFKLSRNNSNINHYRKGINDNKACVDKTVCEKNADSLITRNNELIVKLDNSKADKNWKKYKKKFKSDLDMLGFAVGGLTKEDKK